MPLTQARTAPTQSQVQPFSRPGTSNGGGGGGNGIGNWRKYGDGNGGYDREMQSYQKNAGPVRLFTNELKRRTGVSDLTKPQFITAEQAGAAQGFADKIPEMVSHIKTFYKSAATASDADLDTKQAISEYIITDSQNLTKQREWDHKVARVQINSITAAAVMDWETDQAARFAQSRIESLAKSAKTGV